MVTQMLNQAISELQNLRIGEKFLVKDLFKGYEWNRFDKGDRLKLGSLFLTKIQSDPTLGIVVGKKTSANQQVYEKQR